MKPKPWPLGGTASILNGAAIVAGRMPLRVGPYSNRKKGALPVSSVKKSPPDCPALTRDAAKGLDQIQTTPLDDTQRAPLTDTMMDEMKKVLRLHLRYSLGKELKTARYLMSR